MCVNPLKGHITCDGYVVAVSRKGTYIKRQQKYDDWHVCYDVAPLKPSDHVSTAYIDLPCRKCVECIEMSKREWIARAIAEAQMHEKMLYLTFTYDPKYVHWVRTVDDQGVIYKHMSLKYVDFQHFMMRLRNHFKDRKIRYMVCGEYGTKTHRPHYHAVLYGIDMYDFRDLKVYGRNRNGDLLYQSDIMSLNLWQVGYCTLGECTHATIGYVAGYVDKKYSNMRGSKFYELCGIEPPMIRASNKPGLGAGWLEKNMHKYKSVDDYVSLSAGLDDPNKIYLTEYWRKKYENKEIMDMSLTEIDMYDKVKKDRRVKYVDPLLDIERKEVSKDEYLRIKKEVKERKLSRKVRDF